MATTNFDAITLPAAGTITIGSTILSETDAQALDGVTATPTEINKLAGVTAGTATASKAVVLDASKGIATITSATITTATIPNFSGAETHAGAITAQSTIAATGAITPTGGIAAAGGFTAKPAGIHTLGTMASVTTYGTDASNTNTEAYNAAIFVPCNMSVTGISVFNGSAVAGNIKAYLFASNGTTAIGATASTAQSGTDAYQRMALVGGPIAVLGPATYYISVTGDTSGGTQKLNLHTYGEGPAWKSTGLTYGTNASVTPVTTFTADVGCVASIY